MKDNIDVFPWSVTFDTGITQIDEEHKVLVTLINKLASHLYTDPTGNTLNEVFDQLADYASFHFQSEEDIWAKYFSGNPKLHQHKDTHSTFLSDVTSLKNEENEGIPLSEVVENTVLFLTKWLTHHILGSDMSMAKVALGLESGLSMHEAQGKADKEMPEILRNTPFGMHEHFCRRTLELKKEINDRKETEKKLKLISRVFHDTKDGIMITDSDGIIIDVNPTFCEITGFTRDEAIGQTPRILNSGKYSPEFYKAMWKSIIEQGSWKGEIWNRKKDGVPYLETLTISKLIDEQGNIENYVGIFSDITEIRQQQQTIDLMAHYDVLTGLPNRSLFTDRYSQAVKHSKHVGNQLAICFLDIDDFKLINDHYGDSVGDTLLIEVAERIKNTIQDEDTVSRQGGDEFTLILGDIESVEQCGKIIEQLHYELSQPFVVGESTIKLSVSSGFTLFPSDNNELDTLLRHADQAMYQAKLDGKNCYHLFNAEQDKHILQKIHRLDEIDHALLDNQFCLYYQPKVNMKTGIVFGAEALIRWKHPTQGLVPPFDFLPAIEGTYLDIKVGDWVIYQALEQLEHWKHQGIELEMSINVSPYHLLSPLFFTTLDNALKKYPDVNSNNLQLEILESSAIGDITSISSFIRKCQNELGIKVALDDFGTGYSSLTHMRNLPAQTIKIDQSFVRDILDDPNDYAIVDGVIGLAESFNREIIAEGVETTEQGLMLILMGCDEAQGYGIAKPMPAKAFPVWMANYIPNNEWVICSQKSQSSQERNIKLLKLTVEHWFETLKSKYLLNDTDELKKENRLVHRSHIKSWVKRLRKDALFSESWLDTLSQSHDVMTFIGNQLVNLDPHKNPDLTQLPDEIQTSYNKVMKLLNEYS